jgi:hypothetical protein
VSGSLIDVNVNLSRWPTRRLPGDETAALVARLQAHGVVEAWAGSFDALLHKDIAAVNARLTEECRAHNAVRLVPFGAVNPRIPDWEEDLRRCAEVYRMPGVRLYPNYHGYALDDPDFVRLLQLATRRRLIVSLAAQMEDERIMHPLLRVPPVDLTPLPDTVRSVPGLRLVILNAGRLLRGERLVNLLQAGEVHMDIAMTEGLGSIAELLREAPLERVLFGSHAPFFYVEGGILKLQESALALPQLTAIQSGNARRLLPVLP